MTDKKSVDRRVWLCDLTYTQQTVAADTIPMAIGCMAMYAETVLDLPEPIRLFKYPEDLCEALDTEGAPDVIGLSNYCWNTRLSLAFAALIKKHHPECVTVMGGPHYPVVEPEQIEFLAAHPAIDFYVVKEGEVAFAQLLEALEDSNFDIPAVQRAGVTSVHALEPDGTPHMNRIVDRIVDLNDIPSPYTAGRLDKFFDGRLMPLLQTNRGCPFSCTFCVEGSSYYSKVRKYTTDRVQDDVSYIGQRMADTRGEQTRNDLFIADSNFGMYPDDIDTAKALKQTRDDHGWPEYINVATGKNKKERVIETAKIIDGALRLSGSVQSLDDRVLENVKRQNISSEQLVELGLAAQSAGVNSYSEIILGLPGDSREAHFETIRKVMDAGFNIILPWQLMLLPGSEMGTKTSIKHFGMKTQFRVLPRCFGNYETLGENIIVAEVEEVCIASDTLPFEDYLECRRLNLFIAIFNNDAVFSNFLKLLRQLDIKAFRWIEIMMQAELSDDLQTLMQEFRDATVNELWEEREALEKFTSDAETIDKYIAGDIGYNILYVHRTKAITRHIAALCELAQTAAYKLLAENGIDDPRIFTFVDDSFAYHTARVSNIFDHQDDIPEVVLSYDMATVENEPSLDDLDTYRYDAPRRFRFELSDEQRATIFRFLEVFGGGPVGIGRILSRVFVRKLYRAPIAIEGDVEINIPASVMGAGWDAQAGGPGR